MQHLVPFGVNVATAAVDVARDFYARIYGHDDVKEGVCAGFYYLSLMRDGEVLVTIWEKGENSPLADSFPALMVESVKLYEEEIQSAGGTVIIAPTICPCTASLFMICADPQGNQFMVKEPRK